MKNTNFKVFGGKAAKTLLILGILTFIGLSSCKKDNSPTGTGTVTEADAAELATDAVTPSTGGFVVQASTSVTIYASVSLSCGEKKDTTITKSSAAGIVPSYGYSLNWDYELNCNGLVPNQFTFNFTGSSNYTGVRMASNDSSTGAFQLSGIQPSADNYTLNASYERKGDQTSKIGYQNSFTSDLKIVSSNILISKTSQEIVSGSATVSITGATAGGKSFSFNGTITFLGDKKATLVLNSGASYSIQWS